MLTWPKIRNLHKSETALVIGNGPSLNDIPRAFLEQFPSFGTNRIYLYSGFLPTYYVCVNPLVLEQLAGEIAEATAGCKAQFVPTTWVEKFPRALGLISTPVPLFSYDPQQRVYEGFTVTFVALQLAYYMGFKRVLLVGVDHSFSYDGYANEQHAMGPTDPNHFTPDYFAGLQWNNPDLLRSEAAYRMAKRAYAASKREIINCSTRTALTVFDRADWRQYV